MWDFFVLLLPNSKDITDRQFDNKYGTHFYENLSKNLVAALNVKQGFSPTNLKYTKYFYNLYSPLSENRWQPADELVNANRQQPADDFEKSSNSNFLKMSKLYYHRWRRLKMS